MTQNKYDRELEFITMEQRIQVTRQDLKGDPLLSAKLVLAARENRWRTAEKLLARGADPRICRFGDAYGVESALYYALIAQKFAFARKLFDAGDRLDDLVTEDGAPIPAVVLDVLAIEMRCGRNYFYDESKTLSECCRCSAFEQIEKLLPEASQEELDKCIEPTVRSWIRNFHNSPVYLDILEKLLARGAKLSETVRAELLDSIEYRFKCPRFMRPGRAVIRKVVSLIRKA